jgi:hypothetical protein
MLGKVKWMLLFSMFCAFSVHATMVMEITDDALVAQSDIVAVGRILAVQELMQEEPSKGAVTQAELWVEENVVGTQRGARLVVEALGGRVLHRNIQSYVAGAPVFKPGQRLVVFLKQVKPGVYRPIGFSTGVFQVGVENGQSVVRRSMAGMKVVPRAGSVSAGVSKSFQSIQPQTLDVFLGQVRAKVAQRAKQGQPQ